MASSLRGARDDVKAAVEMVSGFAAVFGREMEPENMPKPASATVAPAGKSVTGFTVAVRVFADGTSDPDGAIDNLADLTDAVEAVLEVAWVFTDWAVEWSEDHGAWVASTTVEVPREDF